MVDAALPVPRAWRRERLGPRAVALLLIILIHVALVLALLFARSVRKVVPPVTTVVRMIELPAPAAAPKPKATPRHVTSPNAAKAPVPIVKVPPQPDAHPPLFKTELMEAVDISKLPSHKGEQVAEGTGGAGVGTAAGDGPYGAPVGSGPHGEALYAADWYRRPTDAEIAPFLPIPPICRAVPDKDVMARADCYFKQLPPVATADIICRTIERFAVEDCQELGESPPGTGLSRAIRRAGWQFKVKPVRLGQKFEVGTWVRIRYTITTAVREGSG